MINTLVCIFMPSSGYYSERVMYGLSVVGTLLLMFFATLLRTLGLGCICIGMSGSRILLPRCFVRGLPRVLCSAHERVLTIFYCCADVQECLYSWTRVNCTS